MKIDIVEVEADNEYQRMKLSIDGEIDPTSNCYSGGLSLKDRDIIEKISGLKISQLRENFDSLFPATSLNEL